MQNGAYRMKTIISGGILFALTSLSCLHFKDAFDKNFQSSVSTSITCPSDYLVVPFNATVGTASDFCVAKYEMKCLADATGLACGGTAISQVANQPWVNISQASAMTACSNLGTGYHLITNPEWMTIARNIEANSMNWSSGNVNSGAINSGHNDGVPNNPLAGSTDVDGCFGTGQTCTNIIWAGQRRTHVLSNGEVFWDFSGNVWEWIDWQVTLAQKAYVSSDGAPGVFWREWTAIDTNISLGSTMEPKTWQATNLALNSANGIGMYSSGTVDPAAALRGASWNDNSGAGVYSLTLVYNSATIASYVGFRCTK